MDDRIFISYRHQDSGLVCDRMYGTLKAAYGANRVFRDLEAIPAGVDFHFTIEQALRGAKVMLVLIGPQWLTAADATGKRRLDNPADTARQEIEYGLTHDIIIVPVLVQGAEMPSASELPEGLKSLSAHNARQVRPDPDYLGDMRTIMRDLAEFLPATTEAHLVRAAIGATRVALGFLLGVVTVALTALSLATWIHIPVLSDLVRHMLGH